MRIGAFGEVMLRLSPPENLLLEQTDTLRMMFTGTGVNILANLAAFGKEVSMLSSVPDNRLGKTAIAHLRKLGVTTQFVQAFGNHIGSYFAEMGFGARPTMVT
ncbi:MAG: PfkB family carbohydrate kinase, partial [Streptococcaceae bacterium]|nr:PfkB family carbohydrate kinase [Streptococcaceae bacterium]